jgi:lysophospholipase L1-like esterase
MRRTLTIPFVSLIVSLTLGGALHAAPTLYLVGDSTVCGFNDPYYYPRYGYGTQIGGTLDPAVTVVNLALSGRSSRSFLTEAAYQTLVTSLKPGDVLLIGFGHNDEKLDVGLHTDPGVPVSDPRSFAGSLDKGYIQVARDRGAVPVLCTPIVRRDPSGVYDPKSAFVHVTAEGDYAQAIRDLAQFRQVPLVDLTKLTRDWALQTFAAAGAEGTARLQAWVNDTPGSVDNTHTNLYGAAVYATLVARELRRLETPVKPFVKADLPFPSPDLLKANPGFKTITYQPPTKSELWKTTGNWWATVFGDCGGPGKLSDGSFVVEESPQGVSLQAGAHGAAGKIASGSEGLVFYFQKLPLAQDFVLSARVKVAELTANDQVSFGLMVRDAVWTDAADPSLISASVVAGPLKLTKGRAGWSSYSRQFDPAKGTFGLADSQGYSVGSPAQPATTVSLKIAKVGAVYTVTYGDEPPKTYTVDLNSIDPGSIYVGAFVARQARVEFSDLTLVLAP